MTQDILLLKKNILKYLKFKFFETKNHKGLSWSCEVFYCDNNVSYQLFHFLCDPPWDH